MLQEANVFLLGLATATALYGAWRWPHIAVGFLLTGSAVLYGLLDFAGAENTASLSAAVGAASSVSAMLRMLSSRGAWRHFPVKAALLFGAFITSWFIRWLWSPPPPVIHDSALQFSERATYYMLVFSALPFLLGLTFSDARLRHKALWSSVGWGALGLVTVGVLWLGGRSTQGLGYENRWEPIRALSGLTLSLELGLACVAFVGLSLRRVGSLWLLARAGVVVATLAVQALIGQRGPLAFTVLAVVIAWLVVPVRRPTSMMSVWLVAVALALGASAALLPGTVDLEGRALRADAYTLATNQDRLEIWRYGLLAWSERPLLGWGGALVGTPVGQGYWTYAHSVILDPLVETGLLGTLPLLGLGLMAAGRMRRAWRTRFYNGLDVVLPVLALAAFRAQVSGHISNARQLWILFAMALTAMPLSAPHLNAPAEDARPDSP